MVDACEAASRSLENPDVESVTNLVNGIIDSQLASDQFINADITLKNITKAKKMFIKRLLSIYHVRMEYPEK